MKLWLSCGLLASLFWGTYIILNKIVISPKHYGLSSSASALFMGIGVAITLACYFVLDRGSLTSCSLKSGLVALLPGIIWALGMVVVLYAVGRGAPVSKLVLVYNTNTFFAVLLGVFVLKEVPQGVELIRVVAGAILVTAGVILAS